MAGEMTYVTITDHGGGSYSGTFGHTDWGAQNRPMFHVKLIAECEDNFFSFLPWADECEVGHVDVEIVVQGYVQDNVFPIPDVHYWFKVEKVGERDKGSCRILELRWRMWQGVLLLPQAGVGIDAPLIDASGNITTAFDKEGNFFVKVCCKKTGENCEPEYSRLAAPAE